MSEPAAPVCEWHPGRVTWVLCARCGRAICPECMTSAPVGFHCPACIRAGRPAQPRQVNFRAGAGQVTRTLIGICVGIFLLGAVTGIDFSYDFGLAGYAITQLHEYYRLLTAMFLHAGIMHILFNMLILYQLGTALEGLLGSGRFLGLYLLSGLGGGLASITFNDPMVLSVGASGAIFGLMGAYAALSKRLRLNNEQVVGLIVVNLILGFVLPGIDWHAHVGGLVTGAALASAMRLGRR